MKMNMSRSLRIASLCVALVAVMFVGGIAFAQSAQVQGLITARSGATMTVQSQDQGNVVVVLTPATQVQEVEGLFHARKKEYARTWPRRAGTGGLQRAEPDGGRHR